jgi:ribonuclease P protein component
MKGKRLSVDGLSLFYTKNKEGSFRVGISVSKKLANAVKRNRLKRQIRDCVMRVLKNHEAGYDMVFVVRKELSAASYEKILKTVDIVLQRAVLHG